MELPIFLYVMMGTLVWLMLTGRDSDLVKGYHERRYSAMTVIQVSFVTMLAWPRLVLIMITGKV